MLLIRNKKYLMCQLGGLPVLFYFNGKSLFMKMWENWNSCTFLLHVFSMENNVAIPESSNDRITIWQFHFWAYIKRTQIVDSCFYIMLIAVLFTTDKQVQYNKCSPRDEWKNKMWYIHTTDPLGLTLVKRWKQFKYLLVNEWTNHTHKHTQRSISYLIFKSKKILIYTKAWTLKTLY